MSFQNSRIMKFDKNPEYYNHRRTELIEMLPYIKGKYLEIGCGGGATLEYLKSKGASYVAGVDLNKEAIERASRGNLDIVLNANVEKDQLPFKEKEFDCIIFADVLEHLYNPWEVFKKMTSYLVDEGYVLLSIPNVKHYKSLMKLISNDEWAYSHKGTLDNTHIRFFTLKEIKRLIDYTGLSIIRVKYKISSNSKLKILNRLLFNKLQTFLAKQYYILAQKRT